MAPVQIPFFASTAVLSGGTYTAKYVSTTVQHSYTGKRVRIKLLSWIHRFGTTVSNLPLRMDFSADFYANAQGVFAGFNGSTTSTNTAGGTTYFQNNAGIGLYLPGTSLNVLSTFYGTPTFEGVLLSPYLTITIRPANIDSTLTETAPAAAAPTDVSNTNFGYAILVLDIETIE